jgi:hypothetical protein
LKLQANIVPPADKKQKSKDSQRLLYWLKCCISLHILKKASCIQPGVFLADRHHFTELFKREKKTIPAAGKLFIYMHRLIPHRA